LALEAVCLQGNLEIGTENRSLAQDPGDRR